MALGLTTRRMPSLSAIENTGPMPTEITNLSELKEHIKRFKHRADLSNSSTRSKSASPPATTPSVHAWMSRVLPQNSAYPLRRCAKRSISYRQLVWLSFAHDVAQSCADITPLRLLEMFEVMADPEAMCGRLAARRMTPEEESALRQAHHACEMARDAEDPDEHYRRREAFHHQIYTASHNAVRRHRPAGVPRRHT